MRPGLPGTDGAATAGTPTRCCPRSHQHSGLGGASTWLKDPAGLRGAAALAEAARAISSVAFDGRSTEEALRGYDDSPQRAAIRAIALGALRWFLRLAPATDALLSRPEGVANEIRALLVVSAHQIEYSRNAPQATAHAAVDATRILRQGRASGLVNAVLRKFVAEKAALLGEVDRKVAGRTAHPQWLVKQLERAWPDTFESILAANNEHPPMVLRVDLSRKAVAAYLEELAAADIRASAVEWAPAAVRLDRPVPVAMLPGFREGLVSVQDAGAQLAAKLLDAQPGMRVMDACAAPGGKDRTPARVHAGPWRARRHRHGRRAASPVFRRIWSACAAKRRFRSAMSVSRRRSGMAGRSTASWLTHRALQRVSSGATRTSSCCGGLPTFRRLCGPRSRSCGQPSACWLPAGGWSIAPARFCRRKTRKWSGACSIRRTPPALRPCLPQLLWRPERSPKGWVAADSRLAGRHRRLLLCLSRKDNGRNLSTSSPVTR